VVTWDFQTAIVVPNYPIMTETIYVSRALRGPWRSFILFGRLEAIHEIDAGLKAIWTFETITESMKQSLNQ
jgi:hypothetical protein